MVLLPLARKSTLKQYKVCVLLDSKQINIDFSIKMHPCVKNNKLKITLNDNNNIYVSETYLNEHEQILQLIKDYSNGIHLINRLKIVVARGYYEIEYDNNEYVIIFKLNTGYENIKYRYVCSLYRENDINDIIEAVNDVSI